MILLKILVKILLTHHIVQDFIQDITHNHTHDSLLSTAGKSLLTPWIQNITQDCKELGRHKNF